MTNTVYISPIKATSTMFDDWDNAVEEDTPPKPKDYLDFMTPPLALIIAMQEAGKENYEIHDTLIGVGKHRNISTTSVIEIRHQKQAAEIYEYFAKKFTLRRLKGEYISDFMKAVDELCENRKKIDQEHARILITLPRFYKENKQLESLMKSHHSAPKLSNMHFPAWKGVVEFVEKIHIKNNRTNELHYFFRTEENYLMRIIVKANDFAASSWNYIAEKKRVFFKTGASYSFNIKGYDFLVMQPNPAYLEISSVE